MVCKDLRGFLQLLEENDQLLKIAEPEASRMLADALTTSQKQALGRLLSSVEVHERELRGALPGSRSKMTHAGEPLAGALRDVLEALAQCKRRRM